MQNGIYGLIEVLVIRMDLKMQKGKVAAQCSHATLAAYQRSQTQSDLSREWLDTWEQNGQTKITLKCDDESQMYIDFFNFRLQMQKEARKQGLVAQSIIDAGRTQIAAGSRTVLAIGPGPESIINGVTGDLKLY